MNKNKIDALVALIREHANQLEALPEEKIDQLTVADVERAYIQFYTSLERATTDTDRRFENNQMFY